MEIQEIISSVVGLTTTLLIGWNVWIHNNIIDLKIRMIQNETNDKTTKDVIVKLEQVLEKIQEDIHEIKVELGMRRRNN